MVLSEEIDKSQNIDKVKLDKIKDYVYKNQTPDEISKIMKLPLAAVAKEVDKIRNTMNQPLPGSNIYNDKTD